MLKIEGLTAEVDGKPILQGIDLEVPQGEVHAIMGPNGSGKSTLSYVLSGRDGYEVTGGSATFGGLDLLAMEQPMAIDLRFILSVIKINADLERVGDAAKSISDRVRSMEQMAVAELPVDIPRMASMSADMVRKSLQSFIEGDAELARSVLMMDDAVDAMNKAAYKSLTKVMEEQSHIAPQALNALMISRSLERVADHATNIAEDVIFWVQGADVRHHKSVNAAKEAKVEG